MLQSARQIGGADMIVLLDCEEETLITRLNKRCTRLKRIEDETHIVHQRVNFFKQVSLPVVRYFDELGKLVIVSDAWSLLKICTCGTASLYWCKAIRTKYNYSLNMTFDDLQKCVFNAVAGLRILKYFRVHLRLSN